MWGRVGSGYVALCDPKQRDLTDPFNSPADGDGEGKEVAALVSRLTHKKLIAAQNGLKLDKWASNVRCYRYRQICGATNPPFENNHSLCTVEKAPKHKSDVSIWEGLPAHHSQRRSCVHGSLFGAMYERVSQDTGA